MSTNVDLQPKSEHMIYNDLQSRVVEDNLRLVRHVMGIDMVMDLGSWWVNKISYKPGFFDDTDQCWDFISTRIRLHVQFDRGLFFTVHVFISERDPFSSWFNVFKV